MTESLRGVSLDLVKSNEIKQSIMQTYLSLNQTNRKISHPLTANLLHWNSFTLILNPVSIISSLFLWNHSQSISWKLCPSPTLYNTMSVCMRVCVCVCVCVCVFVCLLLNGSSLFKTCKKGFLFYFILFFSFNGCICGICSSRLGVKLELQLQAYATATEIPDLIHICDLWQIFAAKPDS